MSSYKPVSLPYFAPANTIPGSLPSLKMVLKSTRHLKDPPSSPEARDMWVVRVGNYFVAKYGESVRSDEGQAMLFIQKNTKVPVPQIYAIYNFEREGKTNTMIIMEFIEGVTLASYLKKATPRQLDMASARTRAQFKELRSIPCPPNYYGSLGEKPFYYAPNVQEYGPCDSVSTFIVGFVRTITSKWPRWIYGELASSFVSDLTVTAMKEGHDHSVFSHGDLHEFNVIISKNGTPYLIDYEQAGFYPAFYEYMASKSLFVKFQFMSEKFPREDRLFKELFDQAEDLMNEEQMEAMMNESDEE
ncbi:kinase-like domain-containing protein [Xylaria sp. FL1042]|nr:kinase-like domain-containing protein [Xylaria sp. FL1042]